MKISITIMGTNSTASTTFDSKTSDPAREGSRALLRLVRLIELQETGRYDIHAPRYENKIKLIKLVREKTGWGLKEAKELVESGRPLASQVCGEEAVAWAKDLKEIGATCETR